MSAPTAVNPPELSTSPSLVDSAKLEQSNARSEAEDSLQFPKSAIVGLGGEFVNLYSPRLESPLEFLYASWHAYFGAVISPFVRLKSILNLSPRLYVVNIGSSAIPRKSTAVKVARGAWQPPRAIDLYSVEFAPPPSPYLREENGIGSGEGFVRVFNGFTKKDKEDGGDTRPSLIVYDELKSFVDKATQRGSTLLPFLTSMFEGEDYDNTTTGQQVSVRGCHIGLLGACTLETFADMWTSEFTSIGFSNRLFLVKGSPRNRISLPEYPPAERVEDFRRRSFALVDQIRDRHWKGNGQIPLTPDAQSHWDDYYQSASLFRSIHARRLDTYAFKWMMLLSLSMGEFEIGRSTVERAIALIEYQLHVRKLYDPIDADNKFAQMEEKIRRINRDASPYFVTYRVLAQKTNANRVGIFLFDSAVKNLMQSQEIQQDTGGRKAWRWKG